MKEVLARRTLKPPFSFKKAWDRDENLSDFIPTMEYMEENLCEEGDNGSFWKWWQRWTVTTALNVVQSRVRACGVGTYFQFWEIGLFTLLKNGKPEGVFFFFFFCFKLGLPRHWTKPNPNLNLIEKNEPKPNLNYIKGNPNPLKHLVEFGLSQLAHPSYSPTRHKKCIKKE